jgi:hypothetical protein
MTRKLGDASSEDIPSAKPVKAKEAGGDRENPAAHQGLSVRTSDRMDR